MNKFHLAKGDICHLEGNNCLALADKCHNEGAATISLGLCNHVEGENVVTYGKYTHGEGYSPVNACIELDIFSMTKEEIMNNWLSRSNTKKFALGYGKVAHIEGEACLALDDYSHAQNYQCLARFVASAEGWATRALGDASHTQGRDTEARKAYSDASGLSTIANAECQHAGGKYNVVDEAGKYLEIIGNGTSNTKRSNARTLDKAGNAWFAGDVYVGGTGQTNGASKLATEEYVNDAIANIPSSGGGHTVTEHKINNYVTIYDYGEFKCLELMWNVEDSQFSFSVDATLIPKNSDILVIDTVAYDGILFDKLQAFVDFTNGVVIFEKTPIGNVYKGQVFYR